MIVRNLTPKLLPRDDRTGRWLPAVPIDLDRTRELETENALLRARVAELTRRLDRLAAERQELEQVLARPVAVGASAGFAPGDIAVLGALDEPDDGSIDAFEQFLTSADPDLDKVRRFLLD